MTTTQSSAQSNPEILQRTTIGSDAIPLDVNQVSVSQLLGRDYLLIDDTSGKLPLDNTNAMQDLFVSLIKHLELTEAHTLAITFQQSAVGDIAFTRHDLEWTNNNIGSIQRTFINDPEQQAFMSMLWQASIPATL